jgi:hypothetical protein
MTVKNGSSFYAIGDWSLHCRGVEVGVATMTGTANVASLNLGFEVSHTIGDRAAVQRAIDEKVSVVFHKGY